MSYVQNIVNNASNTLLEAATCAGVGYLFARAFIAINPLNVAVLGATTYLVAKITTPIFNSIFNGPKANDASKFVGAVLQFTATVHTSLAITNGLGYPIALGTALTTYAVTFMISTVAISAAALAIIGMTNYQQRAI